MSLPTELWEAVISHVMDDPTTLRTCALLDRTAHLIIRRHFFHSLRVLDQSKSRRLAAALEANPSLGEYVAHLDLDTSDTSEERDATPQDLVARLSDRFPYLKSLTVRNAESAWTTPPQMFYPQVATAFPSITSIHLEHCTFSSLMICQHFILALPRLRHLRLHRSRLHPGKDSDQIQWDARLRASTSLETIAISSPYQLRSMTHLCEMLVSMGLASDVQRMTLGSVGDEGWRASSMIRCQELYCKSEFGQRVLNPPTFPHTMHVEYGPCSTGHPILSAANFPRLTSLTVCVQDKSFCGHYVPFAHGQGWNTSIFHVPERYRNTLREVRLVFAVTQIHDAARFKQQLLAEIGSGCKLTTDPAGILDDTSLSAEACEEAYEDDDDED